ncbi:hypothetical protein KP509_17G008000 [Ceratopteris richardii]|uniref:Uncharacterized protein n=1 Tax=Ceratopteris richardii TaxID=49495 RepID=A0A8T2SSM1_CERRI|nr:hypothetical protein KP509_17G008000 [Ceratopteris richardii]
MTQGYVISWARSSVRSEEELCFHKLAPYLCLLTLFDQLLWLKVDSSPGAYSLMWLASHMDKENQRPVPSG